MVVSGASGSHRSEGGVKVWGKHAAYANSQPACRGYTYRPARAVCFVPSAAIRSDTAIELQLLAVGSRLLNTERTRPAGRVLPSSGTRETTCSGINNSKPRFFCRHLRLFIFAVGFSQCCCVANIVRPDAANRTSWVGHSFSLSNFAKRKVLGGVTSTSYCVNMKPLEEPRPIDRKWCACRKKPVRPPHKTPADFTHGRSVLQSYNASQSTCRSTTAGLMQYKLCVRWWSIVV